MFRALVNITEGLVQGMSTKWAVEDQDTEQVTYRIKKFLNWGLDQKMDYL